MLIEVMARELQIGDVIGEGQEIWAIVFYEDVVQAWWGGRQNHEQLVEYKPDELVRAVRTR